MTLLLFDSGGNFDARADHKRDSATGTHARLSASGAFMEAPSTRRIATA
jgi:hypothetical protein